MAARDTAQAQATVYYQSCTSELKDDLFQLITHVKNGFGVLSRQEASFLLWYHALVDGGAKVPDLLAGGLMPTALAVLDTKSSKLTDKTCAAGIIMTMCASDQATGSGACEAAVKAKALPTLHTLMHEEKGAARVYAARCLQLIAEEPQARMSLIKALDGRLPQLPLYCSVLTECADVHTVSGVAGMLEALLQGNPDLVEAAIAGGLTEAVLWVLAHHKLDSVLGHCAALLGTLLEDPKCWKLVAQRGGIELLVDLLGAPPSTVMRWEEEHYAEILHPEAAARAAAARAEEEAAPEKEASSPGNSRSVSLKMINGRLTKIESKAGSKSTHNRSRHGSEVEELSKGGGPDVFKNRSFNHSDSGGGKSTKQEEVPPRTLDQLLSTNRAAMKWNGIVSNKTRSAVAGCLYTLAQDPGHMHVMSQQLAASRLLVLFINIMVPPETGKAGKGKASKGKPSKKLALSAEDTHSLICITGALKFLTLVGANSYRVAKTGALKHLVKIYKESSNLLLRRNVQVILSNAALIAENGQMLNENGFPEDLLVAVPARLVANEVEELKREYPDAEIGAAPAFHAE